MYAAQLRNLMKEYSLTQQEISKLANIPVDTIKSWLSSPSSKRYRNLAWHEFYVIQSRVLLTKHPKSTDKHYLLSSNIDNALYNIENALKALRANSIEETKKYLEEALEATNIAFFTKVELGIDPLSPQSNTD